MNVVFHHPEPKAVRYPVRFSWSSPEMNLIPSLAHFVWHGEELG